MALLSIVYVHSKGVRLSNDAYQYLSIAENLRTRGKIATSIVHFDTERARGRLPAPETTFPPGYSLAFNSLLWTRVSPEQAAWLISMFSMISVVPFLWWSSGLIGATAGLRRITVAVWALNSQAIAYSSAVSSEGLFTVLVLSAIALFIFCESRSQRNIKVLVPLAMTLIGVSYWVRYAAILVVGGLIVYMGYLVLSRNSQRWPWLWSLPVCLAFICCGMLRNSRIAGTWRGGNDVVVHKAWFTAIVLLKGVCYHLLFGDLKATLSVGVFLSVSTGLAIALILVKYTRKINYQELLSPPVPLLVILTATYCGGMTYLGTVTMISFGERYFVPILPEFILLSVALLTRLWPVKGQPGIHWLIPLLAIVGMSAYASENIYSLFRYPYVPPHATLANFFSEQTPDGVSLKLWVDQRILGDAPILAADGQATAYLLHRPTVSVVPKVFSSRNWDEEEVRRTMSIYHIRYLVTYPGLSAQDATEQGESQFLARLTNAPPPSWLVLITRTPHVMIFETTATH